MSCKFSCEEVIDPQVDFEDLSTLDKEYIGYVGAMYWNSYKRDANDWNDTEIKWTSLTSNGTGSMIDKKWFFEYDVQVEITDMPVVSTDLYTMYNAESCLAFHPYSLMFASETISLSLNYYTMTNNNHTSLYPRMEYWPQLHSSFPIGAAPL